MSSRVVKVLWVERLSYGTGLRLQKALADQHHNKSLNGHIVNTLLLLEHNPVYTVGIRNKGYTIDDENKLKSLGAEFFKTNRGGLITFHGPGQLVAYPIINLKNFQNGVKWYVCQIEKMIIRLCAEFGIKGKTSPDTGVWVDDKKICAIGIHASRYVTTHGLALNCNMDLSWFDHIDPCGIQDKGVTSISKEMQMNVKVEDVLPLFKNAFQDQFQCSLIDFSPGEASEIIRSCQDLQVLRN
ncbi:putative lipoyltransferase 2, mitochondrial [Leptopilina boulardi]|uniref:putative lipoyltransferase 2, mitochondrial n=1 Tax=Leptopilina boulardi TaxID=63433 RepID=UPI0021F569E1|nr:putative lipoyltransferase 2, mitochondrial [Leptopilina boulardi]XP_051171483.1 putative lipoyltransferase 2, mitochondrial [Leptopilina boulardi]XP_051171484.1 putative lipoyltransferase 2, mitochondrial [Leptopilina boulardi]